MESLSPPLLFYIKCSFKNQLSSKNTHKIFLLRWQIIIKAQKKKPSKAIKSDKNLPKYMKCVPNRVPTTIQTVSRPDLSYHKSTSLGFPHFALYCFFFSISSHYL